MSAAEFDIVDISTTDADWERIGNALSALPKPLAHRNTRLLVLLLMPKHPMAISLPGYRHAQLGRDCCRYAFR